MDEKRRIQRLVTGYDKAIKTHQQQVEAAKKKLEPYMSKVEAYQKGPQTT